MPLDEVDQQVERLRRERNRLAFAQEQPLGRVKPEGPERVRPHASRSAHPMVVPAFVQWRNRLSGSDMRRT